MLRILLALLIPVTVFSQSSKNITLLDHWAQGSLVTSTTEVRYNECFGFEKYGVEYAVAGSTEGTHIFRLSDDNKLESIDFVEGHFNSPQVIHRDYAVYDHYLYGVCDEGESSLQIMDLNYLPDSVHLVGNDDTTFARVHNVFIDTNSALMYTCIISKKENNIVQIARSMEVFSLTDPTQPTLVFSGPTDISEVHDAYVRDNIAYLNCGFDGLRVYDFSNPSSPIYLQNLSAYQDQGYNHQGWLSPDGKTYIFGDETEGKQLKRCSINNHEASITSNFGTNWQNNSVPHNIMLSDNFAYVAYYNEGLRIYDIRSTLPVEVAHYDTYPKFEPQNKMKGAWGIYAKYPSGRILLSDRVYGVFLFDFREDIFSTSFNESLTVYPNPISQGEPLIIGLGENVTDQFSLQVVDILGKVVFEQDYNYQTYAEIVAPFAVGAYTVRVIYQDTFGDEFRLTKRFTVY